MARVRLDSRPLTSPPALTEQNMVRCMWGLLNGPPPAPNTTNVRPKFRIARTLEFEDASARIVPVGMPLTMLAPLVRTVAICVALLMPMP